MKRCTQTVILFSDMRPSCQGCVFRSGGIAMGPAGPSCFQRQFYPAAAPDAMSADSCCVRPPTRYTQPAGGVCPTSGNNGPAKCSPALACVSRRPRFLALRGIFLPPPSHPLHSSDRRSASSFACGLTASLQALRRLVPALSPATPTLAATVAASRNRLHGRDAAAGAVLLRMVRESVGWAVVLTRGAWWRWRRGE